MHIRITKILETGVYLSLPNLFETGSGNNFLLAGMGKNIGHKTRQVPV